MQEQQPSLDQPTDQQSADANDRSTESMPSLQEMLKKGMTLQQVKAAKPALEYDALYGTDKTWTGEMFLEAVYRDLSQKK